MTEPYVFISYASGDQATAHALSVGLEQEGIRCWIAPRDVPPGQRYAQAILEGIDDCSVFLIVFSESANVSPHVCNEIEEAASKGKSLLLVRTDAADPRENRLISLFLRSHQWFDASTGDIADHTPRLIQDVRRLVEATRPRPPAPSEELPQPPAPIISGSSRRETPSRRSIGVDVGRSKIRAYVVGLNVPDVEPATNEQYFELTTATNARALLEQVKRLLARILEEHFGDGPPAGIGIAAPGQVDLRAGTLKFGPNLFGARNVPFKSYLSNAFPRIPIRVDNEVRCATRYELHLGLGNDFDSFACIFVGQGVGSGTVVDRRVLFGHNFCAGEIGHTKIAPTGPPCSCGQIGCLETFVKAEAIVSRAEAKVIDCESREMETMLAGYERPISPEKIVEAIEAGDAAAQEIAVEVGSYLGLGIANYLNLVNPAAVVVGGGVMAGFFLHVIDEVTEAVRRNALAEVANTPIVQSAHSDDGIGLGAALLFHDDDYWPFDAQRRTRQATTADVR